MLLQNYMIVLEMTDNLDVSVLLVLRDYLRKI